MVRTDLFKKQNRALKFSIYFLVFILGACSHNKPEKPRSVESIIEEIRTMDKSALKDLSAFVRSRERGNVIAVNFSDFGYHAKTKSGILRFNEQGLISIRYDRWKGARMNSKTLSLIHYCLSEMRLEYIKVDSCGNTAFNISGEENNEYFLMKNKNCLTARDTLNYVILH
jgi:hypothetical protein